MRHRVAAQHNACVDETIGLPKTMNGKAIYPGTFDPITNGHVDLIVRGAQLFNHLIVAVAPNRAKKPLFSVGERIALVEDALSDLNLPNIEVRGFDTLLVTFARQVGARILIRGLRAVSDFEYEFQLAGMNRRLAPELETVFLTPAEQYAFLSSSMVREIAGLGGDVSPFVDARVEHALRGKFGA